MPDQNGVEDIGGTLRLGSYPCVLTKDSLAYRLYGEETIHERHRHRYEVNNDFRSALTAGGMKLSGLSPDGRIVEMCELPEHPFFIATQAHPELKSRPNRPHPLFSGFITAALKEKEQKELCIRDRPCTGRYDNSSRASPARYPAAEPGCRFSAYTAC